MSTRVTCPDPDALVSYLYGEFEPGERPNREDVSRHLRECEVCATEIAALGGVREQLSAWTTPETELGFQIVQSAARPLQSTGRRSWTSWLAPAGWGPLPVAAAAVIVLGAGLGLARLDVQYDAAGLRVRTGWGHGSVTQVTAQPGSKQGSSTGAAQSVTSADLVRFEERLRRELTTSVAAASVRPEVQTTALSATSEAALMKRLRQLVDESEVRQQQNLQLRVNELSRDFQVRRQADLVQIEQGFGRIQGDNAQQRQMLREYMRNVSATGARPPQ